MAALKTQPNDGDVREFLDAIPDDRQREDAYALLELMMEETEAEPVMYGSSIVGLGSSTITYADGRTQEWFSVGFSPRKGRFSLYIVDDAEANTEILSRLGKHKTGKACIYVSKLDDIDLQVLRELVRREARKGA